MREARRKTRSHERRFRKQRSVQDYERFKSSFTSWRNQLKHAKHQYLSDLISDNRDDSKALFRSMNKVLNRVKSNPLPDHSSAKELANEFGSFFKSKIDKIRSNFDDDIDASFTLDSTHVQTPMDTFRSIPVNEINSIIDKALDKSCDLDPLPTGLLKKWADILSPVISRIVNLSLLTSTVPKYIQMCISYAITSKNPHWIECPVTIEPVSNLPFVSKVIEECAIRQLSTHMVSNGLGEVLQSAYKCGHSTETALNKVFDDICKGLDDNRIVFYGDA